MTALVDWSLQNPRHFTHLLPFLDHQPFARHFAERVVVQGKRFVFLERFAERGGQQLADLAEQIRLLEGQDKRVMVRGQQAVASSPGIARLTGEADGVRWDGAAVLVAEDACRLGLVTAGHNVVNDEGELRAPLRDFRLHIGDRAHVLLAVLPVQATRAPEHDWTLLVAEKVRCGERYPGLPLAVAANRSVPQEGMTVALYCYHRGKWDVRPVLYREECRIYPTDAGVLDYYAGRPAGQLGVHSCVSERGSSGCPILLKKDRQTYLLGTQIERDGDTGAGIARLVSGDFAQALAALRRDFEGQ